MTSTAAVGQAMLGCDAVVHAAAVFSLDPRRAAVMQSANRAAAETVLEAAQRRGLEPVRWLVARGRLRELIAELEELSLAIAYADPR